MFEEDGVKIVSMNSMHRLITISLLYFLALPVLQAQSTPLPQLEQEVLAIAKEDHLPTLELRIWSPQDSLFIDYHDSMVKNIDTYGIGSSTKLLVAVYILHLVETGKLSLNDEVGDFFKPGTGSSFATITIRQLLHHTSGIQDYTRHPEWINLVMTGNTRTSFEERMRLISPKLLPLNSFHYSNSNYLFLERIVEKVTGDPYDVAFNNFYRDQDLAGIHLSTAMDTTPAFFGQESTQVSDVTTTQETYGYAGDVHATSSELLRFMKKLFIVPTILGHGALQQLEQMVSMEPMTIPIGKGTIDGYGSGLMRLTFEGKVWIGHSGGTLKYQSFLFYNPQDSQIIIALTNSSGKHYNNSFVQRLVPTLLHAVTSQ